MREIKFRAWDKTHMQMVHTKEFDWHDDFSQFVFEIKEDLLDATKGRFDWVLMQFTGLKDKNGKEIYEGDIIRWFKEENAVIKFGEYMVDGNDYYSNFTNAGFFCEFLDGETNGLTDPSRITIVGNIYSNPDLLASPADERQV